MKTRNRTWGERIMNNLMDKLADKISAGEMIKANAAAEAAETERLRTQVAQYQHEIDEIRKGSQSITDSISALETQLRDLRTEVRDSADKLKADSMELKAPDIDGEQIVKDITAIIDEKTAAMSEAVSAAKEESGNVKVALRGTGHDLSVALEDTTKELKDYMGERLDQTDKYTHDIGVQVYRNVQAAMSKETPKLTDDIVRSMMEENEHLSANISDETSGQLQRFTDSLIERQKDILHKIEELQVAVDRQTVCTRISIAGLVVSLATLVLVGLRIFCIL